MVGLFFVVLGPAYGRGLAVFCFETGLGLGGVFFKGQLIYYVKDNLYIYLVLVVKKGVSGSSRGDGIVQDLAELAVKQALLFNNASRD